MPRRTPTLVLATVASWIDIPHSVTSQFLTQDGFVCFVLEVWQVNHCLPFLRQFLSTGNLSSPLLQLPEFFSVIHFSVGKVETMSSIVEISSKCASEKQCGRLRQHKPSGVSLTCKTNRLIIMIGFFSLKYSRQSLPRQAEFCSALADNHSTVYGNLTLRSL